MLGSKLILELRPYYPCVQFLLKNNFGDSTLGGHSVMQMSYLYLAYRNATVQNFYLKIFAPVNIKEY